VTGESLDDVVGIVHAKDILRGLLSGAEAPVQDIARAAFFVPGTREVEDVLADMKRQKVHLAIVLDEFGGTAGLVTMEDLLEEIVGPIYDEYDQAPAAAPGTVTSSAGSGVPILAGGTEISDVNRLLKLHLDDADYTTIGGCCSGSSAACQGRGPRQSAGCDVRDSRDGRPARGAGARMATTAHVPEPSS